MIKFKAVFGISLIILTASSGCAWFEPSNHERIMSDYEVGWNDLVRNRNITKPIKDCSGCFDVLVHGYVFAVGHNDSFIIAKQHSGNDTSTTYYYIIDTKANEKHGGKKGVHASLSKPAFDSLRSRLNISHIPFDMNYPENP